MEWDGLGWMLSCCVGSLDSFLLLESFIQTQNSSIVADNEFWSFQAGLIEGDGFESVVTSYKYLLLRKNTSRRYLNSLLNQQRNYLCRDGGLARKHIEKYCHSFNGGSFSFGCSQSKV